MTRYWKVLAEDGSTYHHRSNFRWSLPVRNGDTWTPGQWMTPGGRKAKLTVAALCSSEVLHVCEDAQLLDWIGPVIYEVEVDESAGIVRGDNKTGVRRARLLRRMEAWTARTARLFAADCAESVLHLISDEVSRLTCEVAIYVVRCYADGEATHEERAAAWDAASDAASAAAWDAASAAASDAASAAYSKSLITMLEKETA